jgi:SAM-dependent methyltransferase
MGVMPPATRSVFDAAAAEYDAARPSYPAALFEELERQTGRLAGRLILDWGAGTGIASRQLAARGGRVVSLDIGEQMLRRALARSPASPCVLATGSQMPVRSGAVALVTFAQSWHWFDQRAGAAEVARVLQPGGYWAAWWNRARSGGEPWFADYEDLLTRSCPGYEWQHHSDDRLGPDWTDPVVTAAGLMEPAGTTVIQWIRHVSAADWLTDDRSKSYIIELEPAIRDSVLGRVEEIIAGRFPDGQMTVPYTTTLTLARKAAVPPAG